MWSLPKFIKLMTRGISAAFFGFGASIGVGTARIFRISARIVARQSSHFILSWSADALGLIDVMILAKYNVIFCRPWVAMVGKNGSSQKSKYGREGQVCFHLIDPFYYRF
ncbi:hypothetical protein IMCC12053_1426 [Celeribacter marinus]|uniref:Uncharacterized protein n=1 Tax=Celeribacter marinus TaxID=1397108 RepID=A0A0N7HIJ2_9RHOB|nr:hypothetical protein IMCC12053_1426 [Celeribacter marinus]